MYNWVCAAAKEMGGAVVAATIGAVWCGGGMAHIAVELRENAAVADFKHQFTGIGVHRFGSVIQKVSGGSQCNSVKTRAKQCL